MTIFQKIVAGKIPAHIIYEDDLVLAFLDVQQTTKGHTLVITKEPYANIFEVPKTTFNHLMGVVQKLSGAINKAFQPVGLNILNNNGKAAGQTVFHYHVHIIPRYANDDLKIKFTDNSINLSNSEYKYRKEEVINNL